MSDTLTGQPIEVPVACSPHPRRTRGRHEHWAAPTPSERSNVMPRPDERPPERPSLIATQRSKKECLAIFRRAGYSAETIRSLQEELPDPVDVYRDADTLAKYGITMSHLTDLFGASP